MSTIDELPPDQRAALSILLRRQVTYAEVAEMLGIGERAVHDRAHAALAVLAPGQARALDASLRSEISDYMLGQQLDAGMRLRTRTLLADSEAAGTWARALAHELEPIANGTLPEIPPAPAAKRPAAPERPATPAKPAAHEKPAAPRSEPAEKREPYPLSQASSTPGAWQAPSPSSSRLGGALVLAAIAAAVIVVLILVLSGGGGSHKAATTGSTTSTTSTGAKEEGRITLRPPEAHSGSIASVQILSEGGKRAFYIQAEHLPETTDFYYAIWLYNSPTSALPLSKAPAVGKTHKLAGAALLPSNASEYKEIIVTRETSTRPSHPGHIILHGPLTLPSAQG
jgi:hypothetical protein